MKDHGPGFSILNAGGTSTINSYKQELSRTPSAAVRDWKPLVSWPACPHLRQAEIDTLCRAPSGVVPSWRR